ncbi:MAG: hypothetical protein K2X48_16255 [Chitinophagaceae bacterium]|nr:hypothetical protein [Chitinophagaceae bacterium]
MAGKREFTIDEWFYYLLAKEDTYKPVAALLIKIFGVCDKIALQKSTRHISSINWMKNEENG